MLSLTKLLTDEGYYGDSLRYVKESKNQIVRKNVSIPSWLNEMAKRNNINFSNTLQKALKQELGI